MQDQLRLLHDMLDARIDAMSVAYPFLEQEHLPSLRALLRDMRGYQGIAALDKRVEEKPTKRSTTK